MSLFFVCFFHWLVFETSVFFSFCRFNNLLFYFILGFESFLLQLCCVFGIDIPTRTKKMFRGYVNYIFLLKFISHQLDPTLKRKTGLTKFTRTFLIWIKKECKICWTEIFVRWPFMFISPLLKRTMEKWMNIVKYCI